MEVAWRRKEDNLTVARSSGNWRVSLVNVRVVNIKNSCKKVKETVKRKFG